jgi:hypothetical protein
MPGLRAGDSPFHVTLTTADGVEIGLISVSEQGEPIKFEGALTPVDATAQFRPGGIPREWNDYSAGAGYTFFDERAPNGFNWSKNVWTLVPHVALPSGELTSISLPSGTHGEIRTAIQSVTSVYLSTGRYCVKLTGSATTATMAADFSTIAAMATGVTITSSCLFLGKAYWAGYAGSPATAQPLVQHIITTDTFTSGATCARWHVASFQGVDGAGEWAQWMVGTVATNAAFKYTNSASPLADTNWTPGSADGTPVGDPSFPINKIVTARQAPYFLKPEGAFIVQRFGVSIPNITPHWGDTYHPENGVAGAIIAGRLYANILSGLDMVVGLDGQLNDTPFLVHPGADLPNESPVAGDIYALCRDGDWIVAAVYNSANTTSYICWGKPRASIPGQPGITNFIWHASPCVIEGEKVTWMAKYAPSGVPYLLVATRNAANTTTKLYRLSLPKNGNVLQELETGGPWRCRTDTCTLYLPANPWSQGVYSQKAVRQVATVTKDCSATSTLAVYTSADGADRVQLGPTVEESPYIEARSVEDINGRQIAVSVDFLAGSSTTPPILRAATVWSGEGIRATTTYRGRFRFAYGVRNRKGAQDVTTDFQSIWELLVSAQGPRAATLIDWKGSTYVIAFEQGASWIEREDEKRERYGIDAVLQFTIISKVPTFNDGSVYASDAGAGDTVYAA